MKVQPIDCGQNFEGKLIVKGTISSQQRHFFEQSRPTMEKMIKDLPFDLFAEQSKSKKSITLSTNVKDALSYAVKKNEQNFLEAANYVISDGMKKSEIYRKTLIVNEIVDCQNQVRANTFLGNCKAAREADKRLAKLGVENFDIYKKIPQVQFNNIPWRIMPYLLKNMFKYSIYKTFSSKTPDEKLFLQMKKEYYKELKSQNKKIETAQINLPRFY